MSLGCTTARFCNRIQKSAYTNHISSCLFWESQCITSVQVLGLCEGRVFLFSDLCQYHSFPYTLGWWAKTSSSRRKGIMSGFLCQSFLWLRGEWEKGGGFDFFLMTVFYHVVSLMFHYLFPFCEDMNLPIGKPPTIYSSVTPKPCLLLEEILRVSKQHYEGPCAVKPKESTQGLKCCFKVFGNSQGLSGCYLCSLESSRLDRVALRCICAR